LRSIVSRLTRIPLTFTFESLTALEPLAPGLRSKVGRLIFVASIDAYLYYH
jgi:hypothetical protein